MRCGAHMQTERCRGSLPAGYPPSLGVSIAITHLLPLPFRQDYNLGTPLHVAACSGSAALCSKLLRAGANVNLVDRMRLPPLFFAAREGFADVEALLRAAGAAEPPVVVQVPATDCRPM